MEAAPAAAEAAVSPPPDPPSLAAEAGARPLTILSWNVAALNALCPTKPPSLTWLRDKLAELGSPDLACFQEHKISQGSLTVDVAVVEGYHAFFAHAKTTSAYSGVVTYAKSDLRVVAAAAGVGCCAFPARAGVGNGSGNGNGGEGMAGSKGGDGGCPFECERFRLLWEAAVSRRGRRRGGGRGEEQGGQGQEQQEKQEKQEQVGPEAEAVDDEEEDAEEEEQDPRALLQALDAEGRAVMTDHGAFVLVNTYCPFNNPDEPSRKAFKHNWNVALRLRCEALRAGGRAVVLLGDLNAIPQALDNPEEPSEAEMRKSRWVQWMRAMLSPSPVEPPPPPGPSLGLIDGGEEGQGGDGGGGQQEQQHPPLFVDTFRRLHPTRKGAFTCWCNQTGARQTNYGRRIDYILASPGLCDGALATLAAAEVQQHVLGSDHCPVTATLLFPPGAGGPASSPFLAPGEAPPQPQDLPPLCAAALPQFRGKQASLKGFLLPKAEAATVAGPSVVAAQVVMAPPAGLVKLGGGAGAAGGGKKRPSSSKQGQKQKKKGKQQQQQQQQQHQLGLSRFLVRSGTSTGTSSSVATASTAAASGGDCASVGSVQTMQVDEEEVEVVCIDDGDKGEEQEQEGAEQAVAAAAAQQQQTVATRESFLAAFKPQSPPKCHGHRKAMVLRQVKKAGPTYGRYFWSCDLPEGRKGDPASRCEDFRWDTRVRGVKGAAAAGKGT